VAYPLGYADDVLEPEVKVETQPQWTAGDLAIYILDLPMDGITLTQTSIRFRVAVWGATKNNPVKILLNGVEAASIESEGMYTFEWSLRGSHHLLIRCETRIFEQTTFNIKAPPPPPPMIQLSEFYAKLEQQRNTMMLAMVGATALGVPTGIWVKKKTKVTSAWALTPVGAVMLAGIRWLPEYYMVIPWGLAAVLVYMLAREYADYLAVSVVEEGGINTDVLPLDDEGRAIMGVGPRHWRNGFMHVKDIELEDNRYPVNFRFRGSLLRCVTVAGSENVHESEDEIRILCSPALARGLAESKVIEDLEDKLADARFKIIFMERALRSIVSQAVLEMEQIIEDQLLDQVASIPEARERVKKAAKRMKEAVEEVPGEYPPELEEVNQGVEE
jgi:hypothetical protein